MSNGLRVHAARGLDRVLSVLLQAVGVAREHRGKEDRARAREQGAAEDHVAGARVLRHAHVQPCQHERREREHARRKQFHEVVAAPVLRHEGTEQHVQRCKQEYADDALACTVRGRLAAALRAKVHDNKDRQQRADKRVLELRGVCGEREQGEEQQRRLQRVERLVELHAAAAEELGVPQRVAREVPAGLHAEPRVRRTEGAQRVRHDEEQAVDRRRRHLDAVRQRPPQRLRLRVAVWEGARVEAQVHEVDCPEALPTAHGVCERADHHEDDRLADAERQQRRQQPAAQQLLLSVVAAARAGRALLPHLHEVLQALEHLLAEEQRDHEHDDGHHVVVFKTKLHVHAVVY